MWTGFRAFANGPETILAFQASANDGEPGGLNANEGERLNFPHSGSPLGCCGFHQGSQNLVNFFRVDDAGLPLAIDRGLPSAPTLARLPPARRPERSRPFANRPTVSPAPCHASMPRAA